jgi:hypothetical protein
VTPSNNNPLAACMDANRLKGLARRSPSASLRLKNCLEKDDFLIGNSLCYPLSRHNRDQEYFHVP